MRRCAPSCSTCRAIEEALQTEPAIIELAGEFTQHQHALFLGCGVQYPASPNGPLLDKLKSNLQEVRARGGRLIVFADGMDDMAGNGVTLRVQSGGSLIAPAVFTVPLQLLADHVAVLRGTDVDQPGNPAKSVAMA
ncbi:hypothetical protein RHOFW104R3_33745 [Rhodanobacter denitrificans]|nr:hypothetical protein RHOFW104R3_33745 [Rhodanobacter denitrificans]